ncbi:single-stranded DNA-binding protein [Listeria monocytogenes]|nr:single-stranded DNA-binding protein [Listeria monocytogenes]
MMNRVVLVGRLTKDPELRYTPAGVAVATFTLAVNRTFTNQQGEREADFINCVVWRKPAENVANFLKKGSMAGVDGRVQTRNYEGNDGKRVYVTEIVAESVQFLEPKSSANGGARAPFPDDRSVPPEKETNPSSSNSPSKPLEERNGPITVSDDDLPF